MHINFHLYLTIVLAVFLANMVSAQQDQNCFSVMAGKNTTMDGSVILAHNEDDYGDRVVNFYKVPGNKSKKGDVLSTEDGASIPLPSDACGYLWLEMPGMSFSDSYMNEYGVVIASDLCASREDKPELKEGGIGYLLRHIMAQCARTAKESVKIGGKLIEEYGYNATGRTYCIADPSEIWMMSVVNGKHWVAQRIPDDQVALIPNYYTIGVIDLNDTTNFMGSPDLIDYAAQRGWFDPEVQENFIFREVYSQPENLRSMNNIIRHHQAYELLSGQTLDLNMPVPVSFKPAKQLSLADFFSTLRTHGENSSQDQTRGYADGSPHSGNIVSVCSSTTQYGFVAQLRNNMPLATGAIMWIAPYRPCVQQFVPWYFGITKIPAGYSKGDYSDAFKNHFKKIEDYEATFPGHDFRKFQKYTTGFDNDYKKSIDVRRAAINLAETSLLGNQAAFEAEVNGLLSTDAEQGKHRLNTFLEEQLTNSMNAIIQK